MVPRSRQWCTAQECGLKAVGQSSWGPTVFGFAETASDAERIARQVTEQCSVPIAKWWVTKAMPHGAHFRIDE